MEVTLHTQKKIIKEVDGKKEMQKVKGEITVDLDMSLNAQARWEANFPALAEKEDLIQYCHRLSKVQNRSSMAVILSDMKPVFCMFDIGLTFKEFNKLFDFSDINYTKELAKELKEIIDLFFESASEKN